MIELTFGWMVRWRRLVRDYGPRADVSEAMAVEIHPTLNRRPTIYRRSRWSCSANFELLVRLTLDYPRFDSHSSELSRVSGTS